LKQKSIVGEIGLLSLPSTMSYDTPSKDNNSHGIDEKEEPLTEGCTRGSRQSGIPNDNSPEYSTYDGQRSDTATMDPLLITPMDRVAIIECYPTL
jgi:hypothetical protein